MKDANELLSMLPAWRLETMEPGDPELTGEVEACPEPAALAAALARSLREAMVGGDTRFCEEAASDPRGGLRAVIQFQAPRAVFNQFFNGRTGYRAHFYASPACGLGFNDQVVAALTAQIADVMPDQLQGFHIDRDGHETRSCIRKGFIAQSLVATLSKVWAGDGVSFTGPRLLLPDDRAWPSILCDGNAAWIDLLGAFVRPDGSRYQPKDPHIRAKDLSEKGTQ